MDGRTRIRPSLRFSPCGLARATAPPGESVQRMPESHPPPHLVPAGAPRHPWFDAHRRGPVADAARPVAPYRPGHKTSEDAAMAGDVRTSTARVVHDRRWRVLVAGGGVAALEATLALRALGGDRVSLALLTPGSELLYRPVTVAEAFGRGQARTFRIDEILLDRGVERIPDSLSLVDAPERTVVTGSGERLDYDSLLVATGARQMASLSGALTFGGRDDVPALRALLDELTSGAARSVAFTRATGQEWPLPIDELALLTAAHLREHGNRARVTLVTPEERPLHLFGPAAEDAIRPMLAPL